MGEHVQYALHSLLRRHPTIIPPVGISLPTLRVLHSSSLPLFCIPRYPYSTFRSLPSVYCLAFRTRVCGIRLLYLLLLVAGPLLGRIKWTRAFTTKIIQVIRAPSYGSRPLSFAVAPAVYSASIPTLNLCNTIPTGRKHMIKIDQSIDWLIHNITGRS